MTGALGAAAAHWGAMFACVAGVISEPKPESWIARDRTVMVLTGIG